MSLDSLQKRKEYLAAQASFIKMFDLKEGSMVEITCTSEDDEGGWNNAWADEMNRTIGTQCHIVGIDEHGIHLSNDWQYPFFCLKPLGYEKYECKIELDSGDYYAEVASNGETVTVGCQDISFDTVEKIYQAMVKSREASKPKVLPKKKVAAKKVARRR